MPGQAAHPSSTNATPSDSAHLSDLAILVLSQYVEQTYAAELLAAADMGYTTVLWNL